MIKQRVKSVVRVVSLSSVGLATFGLSFAQISDAWAQGVPAQSNEQAQSSQSNPVLSKIKVIGNQRVASETIASLVGADADGAADSKTLNTILKNLFATGLFADVTVDQQDGIIVIQVVENPYINKLNFKGNDYLEDDKIFKEIQTKPSSILNESKLQDDIRRIQDLYIQSGRMDVVITPSVEKLEDNRVDLTIDIQEGKRTEIDRIVFEGNEEYSDGRLREQIVTTESAWYKIFSSTDIYNVDQIAVDQDMLRRFYLTKGFLDFEVKSVDAELSPDGKGYVITFHVSEGKPYDISDVDLQNPFETVNSESLKDWISVSPGDTYNVSKVEKINKKMLESLSKEGQPFVLVKTRLEKDNENNTAKVLFELVEGPKVYVERIDIIGNVRTLDKVIRREFRLAEGDPYNASRLRLTEQRLRDIGYFEKVTIQEKPGSTPDKVIIEVSVEEKSTGTFGFGAGYATTEGPVGMINFQETNLLGTGKIFNVETSLSASNTNFTVSLTEPYFMDQKLRVGIDVFNRVNNPFKNFIKDVNDSAFRRVSTGAGLRMGYSFNDEISQTWYYTFRVDDVDDVQDGASLLIKQQAGKTKRSILGQKLRFNYLDNRLKPTEGYIADIDIDFSGLGGDVRYVKAVLNAGYFYPIMETVNFNVRARAGAINGIDQNVLITDNFFIGGNSFRGFQNGGIGPRDLATNDTLGGKYFGVGTVEVLFPLGLPEDLGVKGAVFSDFGTLTKFDGDLPTAVDNAFVRASVGAGVVWDSPFGVIRLDYAEPVAKESFDEVQKFTFSVGTRF